MIIALFSPALPQDEVSNGIVTYVSTIAEHLKRAGHQVVIITPDNFLSYDGTVNSMPIARRKGFLTNLIKRTIFGDDHFYLWAQTLADNIVEIHRLIGFDILEIEESFGISRFVRGPFPIVVRLHGPHCLVKEPSVTWRSYVLSAVRSRSERKAIKKADGVTSPSQQLIDFVIAKYGALDGITQTILNPAPDILERKRWDVATSSPDDILLVGRFDYIKGVDLALQLFALVKRKRPHSRLILVGPDRGLRANGVYYNFEQYLADCVPKSIADSVINRGQLPYADLDAIRRGARVSLICSRYETFPYAAVEAMAVGMPTVASSTFGTNQLIESGNDGFVFPQGDLDLGAQYVIHLMDDADLALRIGKAGFRKVMKSCDPSALAIQTATFYANVVNRFFTERSAG